MDSNTRLILMGIIVVTIIFIVLMIYGSGSDTAKDTSDNGDKGNDNSGGDHPSPVNPPHVDPHDPPHVDPHNPPHVDPHDPPKCTFDNCLNCSGDPDVCTKCADNYGPGSISKYRDIIDRYDPGAATKYPLDKAASGGGLYCNWPIEQYEVRTDTCYYNELKFTSSYSDADGSTICNNDPTVKELASLTGSSIDYRGYCPSNGCTQIGDAGPGPCQSGSVKGMPANLQACTAAFGIYLTRSDHDSPATQLCGITSYLPPSIKNTTQQCGEAIPPSLVSYQKYP